ncbi:MAG: CUB domain-containing protein, partial [Bacteroidota bacterium]
MSNILNKLHWIILLFCLIFINQVNGQIVVTVVDGSLSDHDHVFEEYYHYSHVQYIYDKTLIGQSGTITDIRFEHTNFICTTNNIRIYLGNSTKSSFSGSSDWINSGLTLVYTGSITPANGWYNINITDFNYDNTYNLIIAIDNDDGSYCGSSSYAHYYNTTAYISMLRVRGSSDVGDYGSISSFGSDQMELASLKLVFLSTAPCSGTPAAGTTQASDTAGCAIFTTTLSVTGASTEADLTYQWQSSTDSSIWADISGATTPSCIDSVTGTTWYRRITTCTNSGLSAASVPVKIVADCYNMSDGTITTCSGNFYDSGGPSADYGDNEDYIMTFCSENAGEYIKFVFNTFYTENWDVLEVYDGPDTSSTLIFSLSGEAVGSDVPPDIISSDSCITFWFDSDFSVSYFGWDATISCTPEPNTIARDYCEGAALICNLNGYTGITSSFYGKDFPGNMCDIDEGPQPCFLFLGNINNNSWITFVASDTSAVFEVTVSNCTDTNGIQLGVYSGSNCDNFVLLSDTSYTSGAAGDSNALYNNATHTVIVPYGGAPALVPGQTYYIMIDGQSGDVCNYSIVATSGVEMASIDITDTTICKGESVTITASGGTNYLWSTSPPDTNAWVTVSPDSNMTYWVTITGGNPECPDSTSLSSTVSVVPFTIADAGSDTSICYGATITLTASGGTSYLWSTTETSATITVSPSDTTIYYVTVTDSNGCTDTDSVTVFVSPSFIITISTIDAACGFDNGSATATPSGGISPYIYLWSDGQTNSTATGLA